MVAGIQDAAIACIEYIDDLCKKDDLDNIEAPALREAIRHIYETLAEEALPWWDKE